jgi:hypothetical protein
MSAKDSRRASGSRCQRFVFYVLFDDSLGLVNLLLQLVQLRTSSAR